MKLDLLLLLDLELLLLSLNELLDLELLLLLDEGQTACAAEAMSSFSFCVRAGALPVQVASPSLQSMPVTDSQWMPVLTYCTTMMNLLNGSGCVNMPGVMALFSLHSSVLMDG